MMKYQKTLIFCLMTVFSVILSEENQKSTQMSIEQSNEQGRDLIDEGWKVVDINRQDQMDNWNDDLNYAEDNLPKNLRRRRIRKRKRRPQLQESSELDLDLDVSSIRKRKLPQRLDQAENSWINVSEEMSEQQPHNRRRTMPAFDEDESGSKEESLSIERFGINDAVNVQSTSTSTNVYQKVRDPFTALEEDDKLKKKRKGTADIKNILKKTGSLSLSEVLQKKNLSLSDLLMGKEHAISALTDPTVIEGKEPIKEYKNPVEDIPLIAKPNKNNVNEENSKKNIQRKENNLIENQSNDRESILKTNTTEETTTVNNTKEVKKTDVIYQQKSVLPSTNAKLTNLIKNRKKTDQNLSNKVIPTTTATKTTENYDDLNEEGPIKISIDTNILLKQDDAEIPQKLKPSSAKEEILQMMNDLESRRRLSRILEIRNMTLEELIELRERGSSRKHLADLFHNQNKEPEPPNEPLVGHMRTNSKRGSLTYYERTPKLLDEETDDKVNKTDHLAANDKISTVEYIEGDNIIISSTSVPEVKKKSPLEIDYDVPWENILIKTETEIAQEKDNFLSPKNIQDILENDVRRIDEMNNRFSEQYDDQLVMAYGDKFAVKGSSTYNTNQSGLSSAIIASLSVVGVSLFIFLSILFGLRISRRNRDTRTLISQLSEYKSRYNFEGSLKRTLKFFVPQTLPRKLRDPVNYKNSVPNRNDKPYTSVASY